MGVEKVIPSMTDLMVFLAILARSATGQKLSVLHLAGATGRGGRASSRGRRSSTWSCSTTAASRRSPAPLREALYCLRCGACLNVCPVYRQIGGHAYGYTYPGPIGILLTAMLEGTTSVKDLAHASSLCGACKDACPVRIDIPRMLIELRERGRRREDRALDGADRVRRLRRLLLRRPRLYRLSRADRARLLAAALRARRAASARLPLFFGEWTRTRDLPPGGGAHVPGALGRDGAPAVTTRAEFLGADPRARWRGRRGRFRRPPRRPPLRPPTAETCCGASCPSAGPRPSSASAASSSAWRGVFHRVPTVARCRTSIPPSRTSASAGARDLASRRRSALDLGARARAARGLRGRSRCRAGR